MEVVEKSTTSMARKNLGLKIRSQCLKSLQTKGYGLDHSAQEWQAKVCLRPR